MKVESGAYLRNMKPLYQKLLAELLAKYDYASILAADVECKRYSVSASGVNLSESNRFGKRAFTVRVYEGNGYAEYSAVTLAEKDIPAILTAIEKGASGQDGPLYAHRDAGLRG